MSAERKGISIILAHADSKSVRSAFTLALTASLASDPAALFFTDDGLDWARRWPAGLIGSDDHLYALREEIIDSGVRLIACSASLEYARFGREQLLEQVEIAGAMSFYQHAQTSAVSLYI